VRILYQHRTFADGAEGVHIAAMVDAFRALGHEVRVMGVAAGGATSPTSTAAARLKQAMPAPLMELATFAVNAPEYVATLAEIRRFRPDVVILVFSGTPRDGHGHHQASSILGREAFSLAGDPAKFPEQLAYVEKGVVPVLLAQSVYLWGDIGVRTIVDKLHFKKDVPQIIPMELVRVSKENLGTWARQLQAWGFTNVPPAYLQLKQ